jgi:hypothetical protein
MPSKRFTPLATFGACSIADVFSDSAQSAAATVISFSGSWR